MKTWHRTFFVKSSLGAAALVMSGCTAVQAGPAVVPTQPMQQANSQQYLQQQQAYMQQQQAAFATQTPYGQAPLQQTAQPNIALHNQTVAEIDSLRERLRRTERAMIRLDRRMQLIEQSELSRMAEVTQPEPAAGPQQSSAFDARAPQQAGQFMPMAYHGLQIGAPQQLNSAGRSILGTPQAVQPQKINAVQKQQPSSSLAALPSLADAEKAAVEEPGLTVWTISYPQGKVWPARNELLNSAELVKALRGGKSLALFARGQNPSDRQFRDRVRALSQYLGQVADLDSVPIATLSSDTMDGNTIELFATR